MTQAATVVTTITTGDLIKAMGVVTAFLSAVLGLIVKMVLNGTSSRTRSIATDLKLHITETREALKDASNVQQELSEGLSEVKTDVAVLKERSRHRRSQDHE